jgi:hypothetical protein
MDRPAREGPLILGYRAEGGIPLSSPAAPDSLMCVLGETQALVPCSPLV